MIFSLVIILLSILSYVLFLMFDLNTTYGSFPFAIIHISFFFGVFVFLFKLITREKNKPKQKKKEKVVQQKVIVNNANVKPKENYKLYKVKENPNYCYKEFDNRYELYYNDNGNLKYIKTDYKK